MRLLQLLQRQAGLSRRRAQALIQAGRVRVNGQKLTNPFLEVKPAEIHSLQLDGKDVPLAPQEPVVYKFYKPRGMLSSHFDPHHTNTLGRLLHRHGLRGFSLAGRLDQDAEGLMLITNDGQLINLLTHPRYQIEKIYRVQVPRLLPYRHVREVLQKMSRGIDDGGDRLKIVRGRLVRRGANFTEVELVLTEGRKREIKRLFKHFRLPIERLVRVAIGPVSLGNLRPRELKRVSPKEERALKRLKAAMRTTCTKERSSGKNIPTKEEGKG